VLVDLHAHYPMHLIPRKQWPHESLRTWRSERFRAQLVGLISKFLNYEAPGDEPGVTVKLLREGEVGVALSVLYSPFDEIDFSKSYGSPPDPEYFDRLIYHLEDVERDIRQHHGRAVVATDLAKLEHCLQTGTLAIVHAVEGGFHVGASSESIAANVEELARRGIAYVTVAHLFWRGVATNAPALPFLPDWLYRLIFHQPGIGLSELGEALVSSMVANRVLVDLTHMSDASLSDTFALLDDVDAARSVPVIATHMACRFGGLGYSFTDATIASVAQRNGVLGVIDCQHFLRDRKRGDARDERFEDSVELICDQIDHIVEVTGSFDHPAIGTDLDGYIKPALVGLEHAGRMKDLQAALRERYGAAHADKICHENALRVLRWRFGS
jgi:microsomal dipeptidase-like Zn-dependent dipeptidase